MYRPFTGHFGHHSQAQEPHATTPQAAHAACSPVYGQLPLRVCTCLWGVLTVAQGDPQGVALVADLCEPERPGKSGHFVVAALNPSNLDPETLDYLKSRGCFDLPAPIIQQTLVQAYFHYVHPFLPILRVSSFLKAFESPGQTEASHHLLWSIFLAATNVKEKIRGHRVYYRKAR